MPYLNVAIVEDDRRYRESLSLLLQVSPGVVLAGAFADPASLLAALDAGPEPPLDLIVMDLDLPGMDGIQATRAVRQRAPDLPVVILTVFEDPPRILRAIQAGADGYLLKKSAGDELLDHLRLVAAGQGALTPGVARSVLDLLRGPAPARVDFELSRREQQVLDGLVRGLAYKQIADDLDVSIDTVRSYVRTLYKKLQVHSATEAVSKALREGLVD